MNSHVLQLLISFALTAFPVIVGLAIYFGSALVDSLNSVKPTGTGAQTSASRA